MAKMYPNGYPYYAMLMMALSDKERVSTLAKNIKILREAHGLTQPEFAAKVQAYSVKHGVKFGGKFGGTLVSKYERQVCSPKIDNLIAICEAFDVNPVWLCGYKPAHILKMPRVLKIEAGVNRKAAKTGTVKIVAKTTVPAKVAKIDPAELAAKLSADLPLGERLKYCRMICGLSQRGLSARCKITGMYISQNTISNYERGNTTPSVDAVKTMAKSMKLSYRLVSGDHAKALRKNA